MTIRYTTHYPFSPVRKEAKVIADARNRIYRIEDITKKRYGTA